MLSKTTSSSTNSDPSDTWMANLCIEPLMDSQTCALAVFCPCILIGKIRWRIKQKELNLEPLQPACRHKYWCNSSCCSSFFCLCPWYANKFHLNVRSLYAIRGKKVDKFLNCACCTCILMQLDREIRAREGETRLRTNQIYRTKPVLTQPELSLPMKYIPSFGTKARLEDQNLTVKEGINRVKRAPNSTKRLTTEKALEKRAFVLRNVYSHENLAVKQPTEKSDSQDQNSTESRIRERSVPRHWKEELKELRVNSPIEELFENSPSEFSSGSLVDKIKKSGGQRVPYLIFSETMSIENADRKLLQNRSSSLSNIPKLKDRKFSEPHILTKDAKNFFPENSSLERLNISGDEKLTNKYVTNRDELHKEESSSLRNLSNMLNEEQKSVDFNNTSAMVETNANETDLESSNIPILYSGLVESHKPYGSFVPSTVTGKIQMDQPDSTVATGKTKLMSYKTISSATVIDIPKTKSPRQPHDTNLATIASGMEDYSPNNFSIKKRPKWRSETFNPRYPIDLFHEDKLLKYDERRQLEVQQNLGPVSDTDNSIEAKIQSTFHRDSSNRFENLIENIEAVYPEISVQQEVRLNHISKLPIRINREARNNQSISRLRLNPILSNDNIYRLEEKHSRIVSCPSVIGKGKNRENDLNDLHTEDSTNRNTTDDAQSIFSADIVNSLSQTHLASKYAKSEVNLLIKNNDRDVREEKGLVYRDQAAQRALRLILARTSSGVTE